jgi:2-phospho-L-lactate/phosphoenolpyruvate guanylyltransferase
MRSPPTAGPEDPVSRGRIVVPVKPFREAKRRLDPALPPEQRAELAEAMLRDVLAALDRAGLVSRTVVATNDDLASRLVTAAGAQVRPDPASSYNELLALVARELEREGASFVAFLPADLPLLSAEDLLPLLPERTPAVALAPDRHRDGTNLLVLAPPALITPSYGPRSFARHRALAEAAGAHVSITERPGLALDIDTPDDFDELVRCIDTAGPRVARATRAWLSRSGYVQAEPSVSRGIH